MERQLTPEIPYLWPELRAEVHGQRYTADSAFSQEARTAKIAFGLVAGLTRTGIMKIEKALDGNPDLKLRLIAYLYPACGTRREDLRNLAALVERHGSSSAQSRLDARVLPLPNMLDRPTNAVMFLQEGARPTLLCGPLQNFGDERYRKDKYDLGLNASDSLFESFRRFFDHRWHYAARMNEAEHLDIPHLVVPEGEEAARIAWNRYMDRCRRKRNTPPPVVDPVTGEVETAESPTGDIGCQKCDSLRQGIQKAVESLLLCVPADPKNSPPLHIPISSRLLGLHSSRSKEAASIKASGTVTVFDEDTAKSLESLRKSVTYGMRILTAPLARGMRVSTRAAAQLLQDLHSSKLEEARNLLRESCPRGGKIEPHADSVKEAVAALVAIASDMGIKDKLNCRDIAERVRTCFSERVEKSLKGDTVPGFSTRPAPLRPTHDLDDSGFYEEYAPLLLHLARSLAATLAGKNRDSLEALGLTSSQVVPAMLLAADRDPATKRTVLDPADRDQQSAALDLLDELDRRIRALSSMSSPEDIQPNTEQDSWRAHCELAMEVLQGNIASATSRATSGSRQERLF